MAKFLSLPLSKKKKVEINNEKKQHFYLWWYFISFYSRKSAAAMLCEAQAHFFQLTTTAECKMISLKEIINLSWKECSSKRR